MKKLISFTLSLILLFQIFVIPSAADTEEPLYKIVDIGKYVKEGDEKKPQVTFTIKMDDDMQEILLDQITLMISLYHQPLLAITQVHEY